MDPFVIYDNTIGYSSLREKICDILYHKKRLDKFLNIIKVSSSSLIHINLSIHCF